MKLRPALDAAIARLESASVGSPRLNAEVLLMFTLACDRAYLYAHAERDLSAEELARYDAALAERARGKPAQYITGHQEFWGLDFVVTPAVLIPRPETEHVVETVLELARSVERPRLIDAGLRLRGRRGGSASCRWGARAGEARRRRRRARVVRRAVGGLIGAGPPLPAKRADDVSHPPHSPRGRFDRVSYPRRPVHARASPRNRRGAESFKPRVGHVGRRSRPPGRARRSFARARDRGSGAFAPRRHADRRATRGFPHGAANLAQDRGRAAGARRARIEPFQRVAAPFASDPSLTNILGGI